MTVLSGAKARRLVRRDGRRARRALTVAVGRGDSTAVDAVLAAWQRDPESWAFVPAAVFAAAVDPAVVAEARVAIGALCTRFGTAPDNPVERAVYFVLTGQHEQLHALDPDGALLAGGYRGAAAETKRAIRNTMIGAGELNVVRVIADRPGRLLTEDEAAYLTTRLADDGEWDRLWRLLPTVPLTSAIRAAHLFAGWRPSDDAGREFLARLAGTDPDSVAAVVTTAVTTLAGAGATGLSFAPDNSELAVTRPSGTTVFALPGGKPVAGYAGRTHYHVVALGAGTIVYRGPQSVVRASPGTPRDVLLPDQAGAAIERTPDGFVVVSREGVWHGRAAGPWSRVVRAADLPIAHPKTMMLVAADPVAGQLALAAFRTLVLLGPDGEELARGSLGDGEHFLGAFQAPGHLIGNCLGDDWVVSWRPDGTNLVRVAETRRKTIRRPVPVPGRDLVVVRQPDRLTWLDAGTLAEAGPPPELPPVAARFIEFSQDGSLVAVATRTEVSVHDLAVHRLALLAGLPLAGVPLSAMETVVALGDRPRIGDVAQLLRAGLEYRFGMDVALGADRMACGADDIALGGTA